MTANIRRTPIVILLAALLASGCAYRQHSLPTARYYDKVDVFSLVEVRPDELALAEWQSGNRVLLAAAGFGLMVPVPPGIACAARAGAVRVLGGTTDAGDGKLLMRSVEFAEQFNAKTLALASAAGGREFKSLCETGSR